MADSVGGSNDLADRLPEIFAEISSDDPDRVKGGCRTLRGGSTGEDSSLYYEMIELGMIPVLLQHIRDSDDDAVVFDALFVLTMIVAAVGDSCFDVMHASQAIRTVVSVANNINNNESLLKQCVRFLGLIADSHTMASEVLSEGGLLVCIHALDSAMDQDCFETVHLALWAICNIGAVYSADQIPLLQPAIPSVIRVIREAEPNYKAAATKVLANLVGFMGHIDLSDIIETNICSTVLDALRTQAYDPYACLLFLQVVTNGGCSVFEHLFSIGIVDVLINLIDVLQDDALAQLFDLISRFCGYSDHALQFFLDRDVYRNVIRFFDSDNWEVQRAVSDLINSSIATGTPVQVQAIVDLGIIPIFAERLLFPCHLTANQALEGIFLLIQSAEKNGINNSMITQLEEGGAKERIDILRGSDTERYLTRQADAIYCRYFSGVGAENEPKPGFVRLILH